MDVHTEWQPKWWRAAAYVLCRDDQARILLTRFYAEDHPDTGRWTMPGGGMDWGESPEQTALRELEEETGLRARLGSIVGVYSRWFTPRESVRGEPGHLIGIVYEATNVVGKLRTSFDRNTTDAAAWFSMDEVRLLPRVDLVDFVLSRVV